MIKRGRRNAIIVVTGVLLLALSFISTAVLFMNRPPYGGLHSGIASVPPSQFFEFEFRVSRNFTELVFDFTVREGPPVDVYLLSASQFEQYLAGLPVGEAYKYENTSYATGSPYFGVGLYHAVIDNTDYGVARALGATAVVEYSLDAGP